MSNGFLLYDDAVIGAAMSQSSAAVDDLGSSLGAAQLATVSLAEKMRHTGCTAEWMQAVLAADAGIDTICLLGHNASREAEFDLTLYSDAAATTAVYSETGSLVWPQVYGIGEAVMSDATIAGIPVESGLDDLPPFRLIKLDQSYTVRAIRIDWRDPDNEAGYLQAGRLMAGAKWSPAYNFEFGRRTAYDSDDEVVELGGGALWFARGDAWRRETLRWRDLSESEAQGFLADFMRRCRATRPFLIVANPDGGLGEWRSCLYAVIDRRRLPEIVHDDPNNSSVSITIREVVA